MALQVVPHPDGWAIVDEEGRTCGVSLARADALRLAEYFGRRTSGTQVRRLPHGSGRADSGEKVEEVEG